MHFRPPLTLGASFILFSTSVQAFANFPDRGSSRSASLAAQKRPVVVVPSESKAASAAALGAALALCIRDVLLQQTNEEDEETPPVQPVTLLTSANATYEVLQDVCETIQIVNSENKHPSIEQYSKALHCEDEMSKPILHVVLDAPDAALVTPQIRKSISFLGLEPTVAQSGLISPDRAQRIGSVLQEVLDFYWYAQAREESTPPANIAWGWRLHLALLQANCLPKSPTHGDSYMMFPDNVSYDNIMVIVDYLYDYNNPFGGTDPLSCPTREVSIATDDWTTGRLDTGHAASAAYTACRGNGMGALNAACIASSVGTVLSRSIANETLYTWPTLEDAAYLCQKLRVTARDEPVVRQMYMDFGYK